MASQPAYRTGRAAEFGAGHVQTCLTHIGA
jgi:hypothetical protein